MPILKYIFLICTFYLLNVAKIVAQENFVTRKTVTGKAKEFYEESRKQFSQSDNKAALKLLDKAIEKEPTFIDVFFQKAIIYRSANRNAEAEQAFESALGISKTYEPNAIYSLAEVEHILGKENEAVVHYQEFLNSNPKNQEAKDKATTYVANYNFITEAKKNPVPFDPIRLDSSINTSSPEYFPCLTADGETMIFTRRVKRDEDFFYSKKINGQWQTAVPMNTVNTKENEGAETISADGKTLVFTGCDRPFGLGSCDLYIAELNDGKWSLPKNMGATVNSRAWESQPALSADGRTLYFSSNRSGGLGENDIWVSEKQTDGAWTQAKNLGTPINTPKTDQFPFIHQDGETFYYVTDGYAGMGGLDIFYAKKEENGTWLKPINIGFPINTKGDEIAFIVGVDGKTAYFSSDIKDIKQKNTQKILKPNEIFDIDIYSFDLYEAARPKLVTYVKGNVYDAKTLKKLRAKAEIIDLATNKIFTFAIADAQGEFLICLPVGKNYALNVNRKNYAFYSDNFALNENNSSTKPFLLDIPLLSIEKSTATSTPALVNGKPIILKNIFFETGSAKLKIESTNEMNRLKTMLEENLSLKIQINGHTDNVGNDADNMSLSLNRAKAVYDFLVKEKIDANRLTFKGFGKNIPVETNNTVEGKQANRRTEFQIISY
jgi:outer membrane protein OmpA-like peptidoglycan-associated protein/tetratricopeptide (TPR) repeat protein